MKHVTAQTWSLVLCLALQGIAQAQTHCEGSDTYDACSDRLAGQVTEKGNQAIVAGVAAKNTGASMSTINDFLPILRALVETDGWSSEDGKLGFEWSNPLGLPAQEAIPTVSRATWPSPTSSRTSSNRCV